MRLFSTLLEAVGHESFASTKGIRAAAGNPHRYVCQHLTVHPIKIITFSGLILSDRIAAFNVYDTACRRALLLKTGARPAKIRTCHGDGKANLNPVFSDHKAVTSESSSSAPLHTIWSMLCGVIADLPVIMFRCRLQVDYVSVIANAVEPSKYTHLSTVF